MSGFLSALVAVSVAAYAADTPETDDEKPRLWAATLWAGIGTDGHIEDAPGITSNFERTWFAGLALSREFARTGRHFGWEVEGGVAKHFGWQDHVEGTVALLLRWDGFPWGDRVPTSVAIGEGLSYASRVPKLEAELSDVDTKLLNYLIFELDVALPETRSTHLALRLHHRSGAYGVFGGEFGGSNFIALGLRRGF